jgi:TonB-dependent starch-binding outer membrane protein SusC
MRPGSYQPDGDHVAVRSQLHLESRRRSHQETLQGGSIMEVLRAWTGAGRVRCTVVALALAAAALPGAAAAQQTDTIAGRVTDVTTGQPVPRAQIQLVGTDRGTATADDGRYRIVGIVPGTYTLRVMRIGFQATSRQVTVFANRSTTADFALTLGVVTLDEVVTTATGEETRKREQGNVVGTIQPDPVEMASAGNASQLLTGKIAGVDVATTGGTVGSASRIRIRGASSVSLSNDPLIIIDGIQVNNDASAANATTIDVGGQVPSRFNDINPEDIEKIDVLKGPAAAALYGTAAASGVIQITTKRGRPGRTHYTFFSEAGTIKDVGNYPSNFEQDGLDSRGRVVLCELSDQADGNCTPSGNLLSFNPLKQFSPFMTGNRTAYGLSATGGNDRVSFYVGGNYDRQQGVLLTSQDQRASGRLNVTTQLRDNWNVQLSTNYITDHLRLPQNDNNILGVISSGLLGGTSDDSVPGQPCPPPGCAHGYLAGQTPQQIFAIDSRQDVQRFQNALTTTYSPLTWLKGTATTGLDYQLRHDNELVPPNEVFFGSDVQGYRTSNPFSVYKYTAQGSLNAQWVPRADFTTSTTVGTQFNKDLVQGTDAHGEVLLPGTSSLAGATARFSVSEFDTDNKTFGVYAAEEVGWRDRVFVNAALRNDKNSAFGQNFGSITYPSIGASWVVSEENFFPKIAAISSLRLRAANGRSGRQPNFRDAITFFNAQTVTVQGTDIPGILVGGTGNAGLKPERSMETEFGADAGLFGSRVSLEYTHYNKKTDDLLVAVPLAPSLGLAATQFQNLGSSRNIGNELTLNAKLFDTRMAGLDITLTGSTLDNKLLSLGEQNGAPVPPIVFNELQQHRPGYPLGGYWAQPISFNDANHDGIISPSEVTIGDTAVFRGNVLPKQEFSIAPTLRLGRLLSINALFDHKGGFKIYNLTSRFRCSFGICQEAFDKNASLQAQANNVAAIDFGDNGGYIESADFTKLRELSFTFQAPDRYAHYFGGAQGASITIAGRNLHTWTKYTGLDPEVNSSAGANFSTSDFLTLPPSRTWTARLNLNF